VNDGDRIAGYVLGLIAAFALVVWLAFAVVYCATVQVLDGRRVPRHPRPDSAATFPTRERA